MPEMASEQNRLIGASSLIFTNLQLEENIEKCKYMLQQKYSIFFYCLFGVDNIFKPGN